MCVVYFLWYCCVHSCECFYFMSITNYQKETKMNLIKGNKLNFESDFTWDSAIEEHDAFKEHLGQMFILSSSLYAILVYNHVGELLDTSVDLESGGNSSFVSKNVIRALIAKMNLSYSFI